MNTRQRLNRELVLAPLDKTAVAAAKLADYAEKRGDWRLAGLVRSDPTAYRESLRRSLARHMSGHKVNLDYFFGPDDTEAFSPPARVYTPAVAG